MGKKNIFNLYKKVISNSHNNFPVLPWSSRPARGANKSCNTQVLNNIKSLDLVGAVSMSVVAILGKNLIGSIQHG